MESKFNIEKIMIYLDLSIIQITEFAEIFHQKLNLSEKQKRLFKKIYKIIEDDSKFLLLEVIVKELKLISYGLNFTIDHFNYINENI